MVRLPAVDALRALCIIGVVGVHFFTPLAVHGDPTAVVLNHIDAWFVNGTHGVTGFFVVSGFLITGLILRDGRQPIMPLREFYVRRAARIVPLLTLVILLGALISAFWPRPSMIYDFCFQCGNLKERPGFWFSLGTFTFNWYQLFFKHGYVLGLHWTVLWSLSVEEQFYLFYPLLLHRLKGRQLPVFLGAAIFSAILFRAGMFWSAPQDASFSLATFSAFDSLGLGAAAYLIWLRVDEQLRKRPYRAVLLAVLGAWLAGKAYLVSSPFLAVDNLLGPFFLSVGCALFLIGGCSLPDKLSRLFLPLAWIGSLSYGLYLLQTTVFFFLAPLKPHIHSYDMWAFTYSVGLLSIAWASYRFFEMPINRWIRKRWGTSE